MPITIDEFKELLKDEKNAEEIKTILKAVGFESQEDVQGLKAKNNEILLSMKKIKEDKANLQKLIDDPDYQEYLAKKENPDQQQAQSSGNTEFDKLQREMKKLSVDYEKLVKEKARLAEEKTQIESTFFQDRIDTQLSAALEGAGFKTHKALLQQALRGKAKIEHNEGKYTVVIEDENGIPLPVKEYAISYANSEFGKNYLDKPENKGANSQGFNGGSVAGKVMQVSAFNSMSPKDQATFMKNGGTLKD